MYNELSKRFWWTKLSESDVGNMDQGLPPNTRGIGTGHIEGTGVGSRSRRQDLPVDARAMQGVWLLIGSLGVFFFASILLYVVYIAMRLQSERAITQRLILPWSFLPSTLLLIGVSVCLEWGLRAARRDRHVQVRRLVVAGNWVPVCSIRWDEPIAHRTRRCTDSQRKCLWIHVYIGIFACRARCRWSDRFVVDGKKCVSGSLRSRENDWTSVLCRLLALLRYRLAAAAG